MSLAEFGAGVLVPAPCLPDCSGYFAGNFRDPNGFNLTEWNTSQVTDMGSMFAGLPDFNQDISGWDVSNVTNMTRMFLDASSFNQSIGIWDVSAVRDMREMFHEATAFNESIGSWNVSNVLDFTSTFSYASSFNQPIGGWDVSRAVNMSRMFGDAIAFNQPINDWNVSSVRDMHAMFQSAASFNQPLDRWNVSGVTSITIMFDNARSFNQPLNTWNTSSLTSARSVFSLATSFNGSVSSWNVGSVTSLFFMFSSATSFNQPVNTWNTSSVTEMYAVFSNARAFNQSLDRWDVSRVNDMGTMFSNATLFNQPIGQWDVSSVTSIGKMFRSATSFNQPLDSWNVSSVINMDAAFADATSFNQSLICWCVKNIPMAPLLAPRSPLSDDKLPVWGTCPINCNSTGAASPPVQVASPSNFNSSVSPNGITQGDTGAIVGGIIGAVVAAALVGGLIAFVLIRRKKAAKDMAVTARASQFFDDEPMQTRSSAGNIDFSDLTVTQELGRGSWGTVSLAIFKGQFIALKVTSSKDSSKQSDQLSQEADVMGKVQHRNVVRFLGVCTDSERLGILMEFCPQGSLAHFLTRNPVLKEIDSFKFIYGSLEGMIALSAANVVHCDLAARNILLDENLFAKVSDFGTARTIDSTQVDQLSQGDTIGPFKWQAPEVLASQPYSEQSDVWSFGCTVVEIMTHSEPYVGYKGSILQLIAEVRDGSLNPFSHLETTDPKRVAQWPEWVIAVLRSCFVKDPPNRPTFREIRLRINRAARPLLRLYEAEQDEVDSLFSNQKDAASRHYFNAADTAGEVAARTKVPTSNNRELLLGSSLLAENVNHVDQLGKLGEGSFGEVFLGRLNGQYVAIKVLNLRSDDAADNVRREAGVMSLITPHRNVVQLFGILKENDKLSMVLEFCPNGSLEDYVAVTKPKAGRLSEALCFKWALGICRGMAHLAACNVVHRDLSARNVLLDSILEPKIADFGMGRAVLDPSQETSTQTDIGPVRWFAPECFDLRYSEKSDVWSYGATLIEIYTGEVPFARTPLMEVIRAVQKRGQSPINDLDDSQLPPWLLQTLQKCFMNDAKDRPTFAQLGAFLESQANTIEEIRAAEETIQRRRNKRAGTILAD